MSTAENKAPADDELNHHHSHYRTTHPSNEPLHDTSGEIQYNSRKQTQHMA